VRIDPLPYEHLLESRPRTAVDLVVVHCTELPDLATARDYGERVLYEATGTGNSGHWYVDRDGTVERWVDPVRIAHHVRGYNPRSVGIELVNTGRWPHWLDSRHQRMAEPYPEPQVEALIALLRALREDLPALRWIAGHEDLDTGRVSATDDPGIEVHRKRDPGPMFPWQRTLDATPWLQRLPHGP
jgi:N-acetylmuramoyl-L-alanine amidase